MNKDDLNPSPDFHPLGLSPMDKAFLVWWKFRALENIIRETRVPKEYLEPEFSNLVLALAVKAK